ncbi:MAG: hypothetical protein A2418_02045 [Candidatus Brennerbacteria bacterium RIFOXYC1_FULL_41_11]|uniref:Uncharacterized protein n=1 Tax=Candidatus Brennerbacteria bacterium RIFOXYD1_FULL_41_16 TaxID=1797529 RepID=A0A1G1XKW6_9BACT|nr:MAG: hypothetical protein A2391_01400 [Candidatus Brennerbacteria bacterium RIFOXYB1_FULL_41_13]OGY39932.1 MAG: hypothetical protein A2418_02045 [Candidatus Brennerbacteria bacterium RIFOXYC1_FULL_41_11]OGY40743.1 MAG: hypothetical protein A2570_01260 [Candidatus Brennerbacteria bacterium RIFOXYD1_FULL_41_16]
MPGSRVRIVEISGCQDLAGLERSVRGYGLGIGKTGSICVVAQIWDDGWVAIITPENSGYPNQKLALPKSCLEVV